MPATSSDPALAEIQKRVKAAAGNATVPVKGRDATLGQKGESGITGDLSVKPGRPSNNGTLDGGEDVYHALTLTLWGPSWAEVHAAAVAGRDAVHERRDEIAAAADDPDLVSIRCTRDVCPHAEPLQDARAASRHGARVEFELARRLRPATA